MKTFSLCIAALAAAVTLTGVAAAGPHAAKQRVAIDMKLYPQKTFVLTPQQAGSLKRDSGTIKGTDVPGRNVMRDGQEVTIYDGVVWTLTGKRGVLTIRDRNEWVDVASTSIRQSARFAPADTCDISRAIGPEYLFPCPLRHDPELASYLRIEERELEAGGLN